MYGRYAALYDGLEVSYQGAANFAAACGIADAIERAQSLESYAVAAAMEASNLQEFYGKISFDANHQIQTNMVILQVEWPQHF